MLELAERLVELPATRLKALPLPDPLRDAIRDTQKITSHVAHKRSILSATRGGAPVEQRAIDDAIATAWRSDDCVEGRRSFLERRAPVFQGK